MLRLSDVEQVLNSYVEQLIPAMLRQQYHLTLVKGGLTIPICQSNPTLLTS